MAGFLRGLADSASLAIGYASIAFSFGVMATGHGLPASDVVLISCLVYAGASQFALVSLLAAGASLWPVVGAVALMNLRHLFYGPSLLAMLPKGGRVLPLPLLAFGMTDEVFATASGRLRSAHGELGEHWLLGLQTGAYLAWIGGTMLGTGATSVVALRWPTLDAALSFVLPALFFALLLETAGRRQLPVLVASGVTTLGLWPLVPGHVALLGAMVAGAIGATIADRMNARHAR